jgi:hypothetical protein
LPGKAVKLAGEARVSNLAVIALGGLVQPPVVLLKSPRGQRSGFAVDMNPSPA